MNKIVAVVKQIESLKELNLVEFQFNNIVLSMVALDLENRLKVGQKVVLVLKSTQINLVTKDFQGELSFSNQIDVVIETINEGAILSSLILRKDSNLFEAIISSKRLKKMSLKEGQKVIMLIKSSELSILEFL